MVIHPLVMKKLVILLIALTLVLGATAQKFDFGLKVGLNVSSLKITFGGYGGTSDDLISFHGGVYGVLKTSDKFGIQGDFLYSAQGGGSSGGGGNFNLDYLSIPIMLRFEFTPGVNLQAGPQVGFLMRAVVDGQDAKSAMNSTDFGLGFGIGVDRPSGVSFGFRYVAGLTNTLSSEFNSAASGFGLPGITMTNQVMQFSVGFRLSK